MFDDGASEANAYRYGICICFEGAKERGGIYAAGTESRSVAQGRGISQINCIVAVSVVVVMAIILGIVGYMTFGTLEERAKELSAFRNSEASRLQLSCAMTRRIRQLQSPRFAFRTFCRHHRRRSRDAVVKVLKESVAATPGILGVGVCFAPDAFDGKDAEMVNTEYSGCERTSASFGW